MNPSINVFERNETTMPANFHKGVLTTSSWHRLEEVGVMPDAPSMIEAGLRTSAWALNVAKEQIFCESGLQAPGMGIVAEYRNGRRCLSTMGDGYNPTGPADWQALIAAAVQAGAKPTGAFSLDHGKKQLATFEISNDKGVVTQLLIVDSFDGSKAFTVGFTTIRVVCCNTLAVALSQDGKGMARFRHSANLSDKIRLLCESIPLAIKSGEKVRDVYERAERSIISGDVAQNLFDALFPKAKPAEDGTPPTSNAITRAENNRYDALKACANPINRVGSGKGNLGTLWNAATYLVDRKVDGSSRGESGLDSLLFGSRAKRIEEIQTLIEVVMQDGSVQTVAAPQAVEMGVDPKLVGSKILQEMLEA